MPGRIMAQMAMLPPMNTKAIGGSWTWPEPSPRIRKVMTATTAAVVTLRWSQRCTRCTVVNSEPTTRPKNTAAVRIGSSSRKWLITLARERRATPMPTSNGSRKAHSTLPSSSTKPRGRPRTSWPSERAPWRIWATSVA